MVVDLVGSAVIYSVGTPATGVSVEINVSYLDAAFTVVSISPTPVLLSSSLNYPTSIKEFCFSTGWHMSLCYQIIKLSLYYHLN